MSEVIITSWKHKDGPKPDGTKWHAIFFAEDGKDKPVPWFYSPDDPEAKAGIEFLEKHEPPVTLEAGFRESKRGLTMETWEIIDGGEHIGTSVVAGKGADERPHSPPESEAATGLPPAAPPKTTTPQEPVKGLREALERTHPSLTDNLAALMERCYQDATKATGNNPNKDPVVYAAIIADVGTTARTLFIERARRQK